ncbi:dimethyladenosine transferase [Corynebacterium pyruviciproducens ATCC BAA-1742]|uniref:Ribosomal RNA small subunit methyltransferase A n=1 Tax=Corynebacterium pyruviciproducens ATCC BAA-1742 TaxID=1125779 RepID=S2Z2X9_9CORY|nr:16S rRNA (adenine(1518)-N(6)/adenine(1519)-N(6))-dimethyltransferase RsmA [Corynebacterium pyruviciproducens]EPD71148.1 dimethyladenosine transferase [Corynebacterium pyruviciproducens ATCC BAA-1742]
MNDSPRLLGPAEIRDLASHLDIVPTKKLGQNFLHDPNTVRMIVGAAGVGESDHVVEVGPGLGSLTLGLLGTVGSVTAVEIDSRLAHQLPLTVADRAGAVADRLTVVNKDALTVSPDDFADSPTALVANLPYNVAVPVLIHALRTLPTIRRVLVMVQEEVADRLAASPGTKIYGVPSVKASYFGTVSKAGTVGKHVFWPAPNVSSGLVRIECFEVSPWGISLEELFPLVDAAFAQRRKTLRAALGRFFGGASRAEEILTAAGIDPKQRGEKLGVEEFVRIAKEARC